MIYILTGDIRTGKTRALLEWVLGRKDVDGLLCPDDENGKRFFLKVKSQKEIKLEVESESEDTISIGRFNFLKSAFKEANVFLIGLNVKEESQYIIIDELGKLELKNEGLHSAAKSLIKEWLLQGRAQLILVVREALLETVINHYNISDYKILYKNELKALK